MINKYQENHFFSKIVYQQDWAKRNQIFVGLQFHLISLSLMNNVKCSVRQLYHLRTYQKRVLSLTNFCNVNSYNSKFLVKLVKALFQLYLQVYLRKHINA